MKVLPQSIDAEVAVLGGILIYPEIATTIGQYGLKADDFFKYEHKIIYNNILQVLDSGQSISAQTMITKLSDNKELSKIGGIEYLAVLTDGGASPTTFEFFVDNIQEKSQKRSLIQLTQTLEEGGFDTATDVQHLLDKADLALKQIAENRRVEEMHRGSDVIDDVYRQIREYRESGNKITGLSTGYHHLNMVTSGLQKGDLIILAARPSVGKTAFALNLALNIASSSDNKDGNASVAIFSLEMPANHLMMRILSASSGVEGNKLRNGNLTDQELGQLARNVAQLQKLNIFIDDNSSITMPEIFAKCRQLKNNGELDMIIIDYIQLISSQSSIENRQQEVSEISRNLKLLAREMEVPVIALSQLSRLVERRENNIPQLSDLRESGSIEQDADIVMFLYRDEYYNPETTEKPNICEINIAKQRSGPTGTVELTWLGKYTRFVDKSRISDQ